MKRERYRCAMPSPAWLKFISWILQAGSTKLSCLVPFLAIGEKFILIKFLVTAGIERLPPTKPVGQIDRKNGKSKVTFDLLESIL